MANQKRDHDLEDLGGGYGGGFGGGDFGDIAGRFGRGLWKRAWSVLAALILILSAATSYYQVEPEQIALVTRFGQYMYTAQPGPHFKWPLGVESAIKVPVQRQLKEEFGFRTTRPGVRSEFDIPEDATRESRMLTGDLNVADVEWIVQYKIRDPYQLRVSRARRARHAARRERSGDAHGGGRSQRDRSADRRSRSAFNSWPRTSCSSSAITTRWASRSCSSCCRT